MVIDQHIGALISSVMTALDEYRALASFELDDTADTAPSLQIDVTTPDVIDALAASALAEKNLWQAAKHVEGIAETTSVTADNLMRQMRDARGLLSLARISVRDLGPLATLISLGSLYIDGTQVGDLKPLAGLRSLVTLSLERTDIRDLEPLTQLKELARIHVETKKRKEALAKTLQASPELIIARDASRPVH